MKNINKQEELVSALWDFARGLHNKARAGYGWTQDGLKMMNRIEELRESLLKDTPEVNK